MTWKANYITIVAGGLARKFSDETLALIERIMKIEREIDERVAALYGLDAPPVVAN